jgi:hypothetical protein
MQFDNNIIWERVFDGIISYRGTVYRKSGVRIEIRPKEAGHNVPHCHAIYGNQNVSISLVDYAILAGNINPQKEKIAIMWVKGNHEKLKEYWEGYHSFDL